MGELLHKPLLAENRVVIQSVIALLHLHESRLTCVLLQEHLTCLYILGGLSFLELTVDGPDLPCVFYSVILWALLLHLFSFFPLIDDVARCFQMAREVSLAVLNFDRPVHAVLLLVILLVKLSFNVLHHTDNISDVFNINHVCAHKLPLLLCCLMFLDVDERNIVAVGPLL